MGWFWLVILRKFKGSLCPIIVEYLALRERLELARTYRMRVNLVETDAMNFVTAIRPGSIGDDAFILRNVKSLLSCMGGGSCSCSPRVSFGFCSRFPRA